MVKPRFIRELRKENRVEKIFHKEIINPKIASAETIKILKKVLREPFWVGKDRQVG